MLGAYVFLVSHLMSSHYINFTFFGSIVLDAGLTCVKCTSPHFIPVRCESTWTVQLWAYETQNWQQVMFDTSDVHCHAKKSGTSCITIFGYASSSVLILYTLKRICFCTGAIITSCCWVSQKMLALPLLKKSPVPYLITQFGRVFSHISLLVESESERN